MGLKELRTHCQYVILRDTIAGIPAGQDINSPELMCSMGALDRLGLNPRDMHEIIAYMIYMFAVGMQSRTALYCPSCNSNICISSDDN